MNDRVFTRMPRASVSPSANGCQNGKYFVPHRARKGRSRKKYPRWELPGCWGWARAGPRRSAAPRWWPCHGPGQSWPRAGRSGSGRSRRRTAEVAVQDGVVLSQCPDDREVGNGLAAAVTVVVRVVTDRECVGGGQRHSWIGGRGGGPLQESVHLPAVALDQLRKWSNDLFSVMSTTTCSTPCEPCGERAGAALAAARDRSTEPVTPHRWIGPLAG
jgi:hypothetical protein